MFLFVRAELRVRRFCTEVGPWAGQVRSVGLLLRQGGSSWMLHSLPAGAHSNPTDDRKESSTDRATVEYETTAF